MSVAMLPRARLPTKLHHACSALLSGCLDAAGLQRVLVTAGSASLQWRDHRGIHICSNSALQCFPAPELSSRPHSQSYMPHLIDHTHTVAGHPIQPLHSTSTPLLRPPTGTRSDTAIRFYCTEAYMQLRSTAAIASAAPPIPLVPGYRLRPPTSDGLSHSVMAMRKGSSKYRSTPETSHSHVRYASSAGSSPPDDGGNSTSEGMPGVCPPISVILVVLCTTMKCIIRLKFYVGAPVIYSISHERTNCILQKVIQCLRMRKRLQMILKYNSVQLDIYGPVSSSGGRLARGGRSSPAQRGGSDRAGSGTSHPGSFQAAAAGTAAAGRVPAGGRYLS